MVKEVAYHVTRLWIIFVVGVSVECTGVRFSCMEALYKHRLVSGHDRGEGTNSFVLVRPWIIR